MRFKSTNDNRKSTFQPAQNGQSLSTACTPIVKDFCRNTTIASSTVCVVSSSPLAVQYLVLLLRKTPEFNPMFAEAFLPRSDEFPNPIFVLDSTCLSLPLSQCVRQLRKRFATAKFIIIDGAQTGTDVVSRVALGIHGLVEQSNVERVLEVAVRAVAKGHLYFPEEILEAYVKSRALPRPPRSSMGTSSTTPRETEILELVKRRLSNKEIAETLGVQESTVKFHLSNILGKLQLQSRYELCKDKRQLWEEMLA